MKDDFNVVRVGPNGELEIDEDMLREAYRQIKKDRLFLEAHQAELLERYPDMFVAVYQEQLVGAAATADELVEQLKANDVPSSKTYWRFLASEPLDLVVPG